MAGESQQNGQDGLHPTKLAELLSQSGRVTVAAADVAADVQAGCPSLPSGAIPVLSYVRWLYDQVVKGAS